MNIKSLILICLAAFCLMAGYECIRSPSNTLFQQAYGAQGFPLVMSFLPLVLILTVAGYNLLLTRLGPRKTLLTTLLVCLLALVLCQVAIAKGVAAGAAALYLFRETYAPLIIEQYWSYFNSVQAESSAKKYNSLLLGSVSLGAMVGGVVVVALSKKVGTLGLPLVACVITLPAAFLAHRAFSYSGEPRPENQAEPQRGNLGLSSFRTLPQLRYLFGLVAAAQMVSTLFYLLFQKYLELELPSADSQTAFSGMFYAGLNFSSLALQFGLAPFVLRWVSLRQLQRTIPLVHLFTAALFFLSPSLIFAALAYGVFKALDYSLFRSSKEILYIPLPYDARYRAKEWIDIVGYRLSKGGTSVAIFAVQKLGLLGSSVYGIGILSACSLWLGMVGLLTSKEEPKAALVDQRS